MTDAVNASAIAVPDFAKRLSISRAFAWNLVATGQVKSIKLGKRRLVPLTEVERLLEGAA